MKIIECPRDAMQGLHDFVPTATKIHYINTLLKVGFDTIDFGSFVSPKAIPQMKDSAEVLEGLDLDASSSKLLAIVANLKGAEIAANHLKINTLGFPLSVSEIFQQRNTNKSISQALEEITHIAQLCQNKNKNLVIYLSMAFGNPYQEQYETSQVIALSQTLNKLNIKTIALSDTIGVASPALIEQLFENLMTSLPHIEFGAHFHSNPLNALEKIEAAYRAGCRRFDSAIGGMGGCPMAKDELTGNIATELIVNFLQQKNQLTAFDFNAFQEAIHLKKEFFG